MEEELEITETLIFGYFERNEKQVIEFIDPYDSIVLKVATIGVYGIEIISSVVMIAFVFYETQGLAGHYRTLINQLLSYLYGAVSYSFCNCMIQATGCPS